jgi:hypothetical protein
VIISRRMRWAGHAALKRERETRNSYKVLVGELEGRSQLGRPRHRWEDNIRMDLMEGGWEDADWMHLTQDRDY